MWRRLSLMWAFWPALAMQAMVLTAALVCIWQFGIRDQVEDLRSERFRFSVLHVKSVLEAGLRLGNATADLAGAAALIREVRDRQPDILSIDIYGAQGEMLFSTDPGGLELKLPAAWTKPCLRADASGPWIDQDADDGVQCIGLVNTFGQGAGGVVLRHRRAARADLTLPADWPLLVTAVAALMLAAAAAGVVVVRPVERQAQLLRRSVEAPSLAGKEVAGPAAVQDGFGPARAALQALADQDAWLAQTDAEADRLDQLETA